jgi:hypothetical protein
VDVSVPVPERSFGMETYIEYLFLRKQIDIAFPVLENENAFLFSGAKNGDAFPFSRTGNAFSISRIKE